MVEIRVTEIVTSSGQNAGYFVCAPGFGTFVESPLEIIAAVRKITEKNGTYSLEWSRGGHPSPERCPSTDFGQGGWWSHNAEKHPHYTRIPAPHVIDEIVRGLGNSGN